MVIHLAVRRVAPKDGSCGWFSTLPLAATTVKKLRGVAGDCGRKCPTVPDSFLQWVPAVVSHKKLGGWNVFRGPFVGLPSQNCHKVLGGGDG